MTGPSSKAHSFKMMLGKPLDYGVKSWAVGPATTLVHVFDYPFEEIDVEIEHAPADFGEVKRIRKQTYLSSQQIYTGTRLVSIVLMETPPWSVSIDEYHCRIWYRRQPLVCNLCAKQGHVSANCLNNGKFRLCE